MNLIACIVNIIFSCAIVGCKKKLGWGRKIFWACGAATLNTGDTGETERVNALTHRLILSDKKIERRHLVVHIAHPT